MHLLNPYFPKVLIFCHELPEEYKAVDFPFQSCLWYLSYRRRRERKSKQRVTSKKLTRKLIAEKPQNAMSPPTVSKTILNAKAINDTHVQFAVIDKLTPLGGRISLTRIQDTGPNEEECAAINPINPNIIVYIITVYLQLNTMLLP